jgi:hypothetical protein
MVRSLKGDVMGKKVMEAEPNQAEAPALFDAPPAEAVEADLVHVTAPSPAESRIPMWGWALLAFGAFKLLNNGRRR